LCGVRAAQEEPALPPTATVELRLEGALVPMSSRNGPFRDLNLWLTRREGQWGSNLWGRARAYNQAIHEGSVRARSDAGAGALDLDVVIHDDPWVEGGFGEYRVSFAQSAPAAAAAYSGGYNGLPVSGRVHVAVHPWPDPDAETRPAVASGEHPRLLFRRGDLPGFRQRAQTPLGGRLVEAIRGRLTAGEDKGSLDAALGHGFLYALFGEEEHGRTAASLVRENAVYHAAGSHAHDAARKLLAAALVYDLVYDALWPRERDELNRYLSCMVGIANTRHGLHGNWNNGPNSNWTAIGTGGAGMAALAVLREKGFIGLHPPDKDVEVVRLDAAEGANASLQPLPADARPGPAPVPVSPYALRVVFTNWLCAGPLAAAGNDEVAGAALGVAAERFRVTPGAALDHGGRSYPFVLLPASAVNRRAVEFLEEPVTWVAVPGADRETVSFLYSLLRVDRREGGVLRCRDFAGFQSVRVWIDGREVPEGAAVDFSPGLHPVLLALTGPSFAFRFEAADVQAQYGKWRRAQWLEASYREAVRRFEATGERQDVPILLNVVQRHADLWCRWALGDRGWKTETESYQFISLAMMLPFAAAHGQVLGEPLAPGSGLSWVLPMGLARECGSRGGGYPSGDAGLSTEFLAGAIRLSEPALQPALAWELNRRLADPAQFGRLGCRSLVQLFVTRPDEIPARPPGEVMPTAVIDRRKGLFLFRNRYRDAEDFVTHFFLQTERPMGPAWWLTECGSFRLSGLGTAWAVGGGQGKREKEYWKENVVTLGYEPEPSLERGRAGTCLYCEQPEYGVGIVGGDLSVFHGASGSGASRGTRHFAVDYTGRCGAPALVAVADQVQGDGIKVWRMYTGASGIGVDGADFTLRGKARGTSLRGRFVAPEDVALSVSNGALLAVSRLPSPDYLVAMTIQKGEPPPIAVQGRGLAARLTVGRRQIRFEDGKLRLDNADAKDDNTGVSR
jgi:hypothetical protein